MASPELSYRPHASIVPFHESHAQVKALCGPVRGGKTLAAAFEFFFLCTESVVPVRGLVVRESYRQLHDSTLRTLREWFDGVSEYRRVDERLLVTIPNFKGEVLTHELDLRHCRRPEEVSNLLSTDYGFIWLEEPTPAYQMESGVIGAGLPKELFDMAIMRQTQQAMHRWPIILTFNPPSAFHWVYKEFFAPSAAQLASNDYALFRLPAFENAAHLPPGYYQKLLDRLGDDLARRFILGEVVTSYPGQRVYNDVYEQVHFADGLVPAEKIPLVLGFDFGRTPCALIGQVLPDARLRIYREVQMWDAGAERLCDTLKEVLKAEFPGFKHWRCWADPSGAYGVQTDESTPYTVLAAHGFHCQPGAEGNAARQEAVIQRLQRFYGGEPAVQIDKARCPLLSEGLLSGYRYPQSHDGQIGKAPLKNRFSHTCNAFEYVASGEFSVVDGSARVVPKPAPARFDPFKRAHIGKGGTWMSR